MTTVIHTCDHCKKVVDKVWQWPHFHMDGLQITVNRMGYAEYCKDCSQILIMQTNGFKEIET